ncbi:Quinolinate phosphoribosyl transferase [Salix suchowensis]|nr:Quinolinate phosphoribosyl transferase [Salix suchowensis]
MCEDGGDLRPKRQGQPYSLLPSSTFAPHFVCLCPASPSFFTCYHHDVSQILLALALAAFSLAYQVTSPGGSQGWTTEGSQLATWTRVDTDPLNFTAVLTNEVSLPESIHQTLMLTVAKDRSVMPQNNQILAALVDGTLEQIRLNPPNGGWPTGKGFRLNFCRDSQSLEAILAQSNQFDIGQTTSTPLSALVQPLRTFPVGVLRVLISSRNLSPVTQVNAWLAEDTPSFDYGGYVVGEAHREAFLFGKGKIPAVLAGSPFFTEVFAQLGFARTEPYARRVKWHTQEGETFEPVKHVATVSGKARHLLLGERVALNILARCSGIATKLHHGGDTQARAVGGFTLLLDVEVRNEVEADEAIDAGADIIMLDNMEGDELVDVPDA